MSKVRPHIESMDENAPQLRTHMNTDAQASGGNNGTTHQACSSEMGALKLLRICSRVRQPDSLSVLAIQEGLHFEFVGRLIT